MAKKGEEEEVGGVSLARLEGCGGQKEQRPAQADDDDGRDGPR